MLRFAVNVVPLPIMELPEPEMVHWPFDTVPVPGMVMLA